MKRAIYLLLLLWSSVVFADYAATFEWLSYNGYPTSHATTPDAACSAIAPNFSGFTFTSTTVLAEDWVRCVYTGPAPDNTRRTSDVIRSLGCSQGGTLNGNICIGQTCPLNEYGDKPDTGDANYPLQQPSGCTCPPDSKWYPGGCRKTCDHGEVTGAKANAGWDFIWAKGQQESCFAGCGIQSGAGGYDIYANGSTGSPGFYTGWKCTGVAMSKPEPAKPPVKPEDKKTPPCGGTDGVITSSSGNVLCLPEGTPDTTKPDVKKEKKVETFPDDSTRTTETTTTTDTNTSAKDITTTSTSSGGQAGPAGTSSSKTGVSGGKGGGGGGGDEEGDCDKSLHFCGGPNTDDIYKKKDKTINSVFESFSSELKNTDSVKSFTGFFDVTIPSGGCPDMSANVPYLNMTVDLQPYICSPTAMQYFQALGAILQIGCMLIAFRWVLL